MKKTRFLDIDDLMILRHLYEGNTLASAARMLGITQSAVTQRLRKLEGVFMANILQRIGREAELTAEGRRLCERIANVLKELELIVGEFSGTSQTSLGLEGASVADITEIDR